MTPYLDDGDVTLYHGDAAETLATLPEGPPRRCRVTPLEEAIARMRVLLPADRLTLDGHRLHDALDDIQAAGREQAEGLAAMAEMNVELMREMGECSECRERLADVMAEGEAA